jgi:CBS domain containing-hemolysin-like protein
MRIDETEAWTGVKIESPADTLGGHVMHVLGRVPAGGEHLNINGAEFEVERVSANRVVSVLVSPAPLPGEREHG